MLIDAAMEDVAEVLYDIVSLSCLFSLHFTSFFIFLLLLLFFQSYVHSDTYKFMSRWIRGWFPQRDLWTQTKVDRLPGRGGIGEGGEGAQEPYQGQVPPPPFPRRTLGRTHPV